MPDRLKINNLGYIFIYIQHSNNSTQTHKKTDILHTKNGTSFTYVSDIIKIPNKYQNSVGHYIQSQIFNVSCPDYLE